MVVEYLDVNSDTIVEIHSYVKYISNSRFRPSIEYLMSRHRSYSIDDFVQEVMELLLKSLKTKKFLEINQLNKEIELYSNRLDELNSEQSGCRCAANMIRSPEANTAIIHCSLFIIHSTPR